MRCSIFDVKRACFLGKMGSVIPDFKRMSSNDQLKTILCPTSAAASKIVNKFIRIMFLARDNLAEGININELSYPTLPVNSFPSNDYTDYDNFSDIDEWDESLSKFDDFEDYP